MRTFAKTPPSIIPMTAETTRPTFARTRSRSTRRSVVITNASARLFITLGGVGTIVAVLGVCVFLVYVVVPLFMPGSIDSPNATTIAAPEYSDKSRTSAPASYFGVDEYLTTAWIINPTGEVRSMNIRTGELLTSTDPFSNHPPTAINVSPTKDTIIAGFADGTVRIGQIEFQTTYPEPPELPTAWHDLPVNEFKSLGSATIERTPENQFRRQELNVTFDEPIQSGTSGPIILVDSITTSRGPIFAVLSKDGVLRINTTRESRNMMTGKITRRIRGAKINYKQRDDRTPPAYLLLSGLGTNLFLAWPDGYLQRYDTSNIADAHLAEEISLLDGKRNTDGSPATVTAFTHLLGRRSLLVGDSTGETSVWFPSKPKHTRTPDGIVLVKGHALSHDDAPVTSIASARQSRLFIITYADGHLRVVHATSEKDVVDAPMPQETTARYAIISPKENAVVALGDDRIVVWPFKAGYPEISLKALFLPVWYEGDAKLSHVWQSSSGTDDFEPKFGLIPLIFGTLKATFFSMLFGVPIALLAAIYTSEFLHPKARAKVKPVVELMASLPSVVLGYLAAIIFAPLIENIVPAVLCSFIAIPLVFLLGAYLFQLLPYRLWIRAIRFRFLFMCVTLPIGILLATKIGPPVENLLFAGNIRIWLSGQIGTGTGGWIMVLLPCGAVVAAVLSSRFFTPRMQRFAAAQSRAGGALLDLAKFLFTLMVGFALVIGISISLNAIGFDPRGRIIDTYVQRNALVVGLVMGFAIIPIIYTIADDALSAVPNHLRSAALGAGATHWQTTIRIIIPTAMSGLFSACMIGLGRAVGETMIVLMAAGNTPILDVNIFNGFRTLSANIAVELPEAVQYSTHFRTLFLAALVLFILTFIVNTVAETIRLRFRKRAFEL